MGTPLNNDSIRMLSQSAGIYRISCTANGKEYIGSASNIRRRIRNHALWLGRGDHYNSKLQNAWDKHGSDVFTVEIVEHVTDASKLLSVEQVWLDATGCVDHGYNLSRNATGGGFEMPESAKQILRQKRLGTKMSEEAKVKMSESAHNRPPVSIETREKITKALSGRPCSPETRAKIGKANSRGKEPLSDDVRQKISAALKGKPKPQRTAEHSANISASKQGKKLPPRTEQHLANIKTSKAKGRAHDGYAFTE